MFFDDEFDRLVKRTSGSFFGLDDLFENVRATGSCGPYYYGCTMSVGPDGRPVVKEYGNIKPETGTEDRRPLVDTIVYEKEKVVKLVAELPGVEKTDLKVVIEGSTVNIDAEHGEKKYHARVPIKHKVDRDSAKASYKNGILELVFSLVEPKKPKGKTVEVQ